MDQPEKSLFEISFKNGNSASLPINILQTSIFPVVLIKENRMRSIGTCFAISNHGLYMTAKHVIDEVPSIYNEGDLTHAVVDGSLGVLYIALPDEEAKEQGVDLLGGFMPMTTAYTISGVDVALMHINLPTHVETEEFIRFPAQRLRLDFPSNGERLIALGYEKGEWEFSQDGVHTLSQTFTASTGFAGEIHPTGRDSVLMPTPCFQTSAPFRSGMSGGPVVGENGMVLGVVSTGFDVAPGEEPISYATPLAPSMGISLRGRDAADMEATLFLWDFAEGGALSVDRGTARVIRSDNELLVEVGGGQYRSLLGS
jgi:S1-C subfamily serine protease